MNLQSLPGKQQEHRDREKIVFPWDKIELVFLDMDGTLLDKYFDDYFWEHFIPDVYAKQNDITVDRAKEVLLQTYKSVENTLAWTDLNYWTERLGLDIVSLKEQVNHLIGLHPHVLDFFHHMHQTDKKLYLITNAHPETLKIKMERVKIENHFEEIICSQDVGTAKEQVVFWERLQQFISYDKEKTLFVDDTEKVLDSAQEYGIRHLLHIAGPSSKAPIHFSKRYPSVRNFKELLL